MLGRGGRALWQKGVWGLKGAQGLKGARGMATGGQTLQESLNMVSQMSEEQRELHEAVAKFAREEIAPHADRIDKENQFPLPLWRKLGDLGILGATAPGSPLLSSPLLSSVFVFETRPTPPPQFHQKSMEGSTLATSCTA